MIGRSLRGLWKVFALSVVLGFATVALAGEIWEIWVI